MTAPFTETQGQYLAFIYTYTKLHRRPPAEADFQAFFQVMPPTAHRMIVVYGARLDPPTAGAPRSIEVLVPPDQIPPLRRPAIDQNPCDEN